MKTPLHDLAEDSAHEADRYVQQAQIAFGDSACLPQLTQLTRQAKQEWQRIVGTQGVSIPSLAFIGSVNSGKSWLAQQLIRSPEMAQKLFPTGEAQRTAHLQWVGPERPPALGSNAERFTYLEPESMADLGCAFLLLDTPGSGDVNPHSQPLAETALSSASLKVLVVRSAKVRAEEFQKYFAAADGSLVLPILNFCPIDSDSQQSREDEFLAALQQVAPTAEILEPLSLPDFAKTPDMPSTQAEIRTLLLSRLRGIFADSTRLENAALNQLHSATQHFIKKRSAFMEVYLAPLREPCAELQKIERRLPEKALAYLLENSSQLRVLLNTHFRAAVLAQTPGFAFPYRSCLGLLGLTAGAWDRLILGVAGSLPSLLATGVSAIKGNHSTVDATTQLRDRVKPMIAKVVREPLLEPLGKLQRKLTADENVETCPTLDFAISGVEEFAEIWKRELAQTAARFQPNRLGVGFAWVLGMLSFLFLFAAPMVHLYGEYIPAALQSWSGDWSAQALMDYPALTGSFWLTALLVSLLPSFAVALLVMTWTLNRHRSRRATEHLKAAMQRQLASDPELFRISLQDVRLEAVKNLLR